MSEPDTPVTGPVEQFERWYAQAQTGGARRSAGSALLAPVRKAISLVFPSANPFRPDVASLATIAAGEQPAARSVLFKGIVDGGFTFYTDYESRKGRELERNPSAVMLFYWSLPPRQVRIDGRVTKLSREDAERYWATRTRDNQAASAAVAQSSVISGHDELVRRKRQLEERYAGAPIPCPESWGGYSLVPESIEFWQGRLDWLHERERYTRDGAGWSRVTLAP